LYLDWPFQSSVNSKHHRTLTHPETKIRKSLTLNSIRKQKKEALTLHLHTHHHHHHIHNSNSTISPEKSSISIKKNQHIETKLSLNNVVKKEDEQISPNQVLNKRTTRRKSSPVKRLITSESIADKIPQKINFLINNNNQPSPVSNLNDNSPIRRVPKRRCVSASTPTIISIAGRNSRGKRTNSASNRKRSHSPASIKLSFKKQKNLHYWILFGKSEQKLVSIHVNNFLFFDFEKKKFFIENFRLINHQSFANVIHQFDILQKKMLLNPMIVLFYVLKLVHVHHI
jgi:hypothetical protein